MSGISTPRTIEEIFPDGLKNKEPVETDGLQKTELRFGATGLLRLQIRPSLAMSLTPFLGRAFRSEEMPGVLQASFKPEVLNGWNLLAVRELDRENGLQQDFSFLRGTGTVKPEIHNQKQVFAIAPQLQVTSGALAALQVPFEGVKTVACTDFRYENEQYTN